MVADIRVRFQDRLVGYVLDIEDCKRQLELPERRGAAVARIADIAHSISGIAGSVGYADLGRTAASVDAAFHSPKIAASSDPPSAAAMDALERLLDLMEQKIDD